MCAHGLALCEANRPTACALYLLFVLGFLLTGQINSCLPSCLLTDPVSPDPLFSWGGHFASHTTHFRSESVPPTTYAKQSCVAKPHVSFPSLVASLPPKEYELSSCWSLFCHNNTDLGELRRSTLSQFVDKAVWRFASNNERGEKQNRRRTAAPTEEWWPDGTEIWLLYFGNKSWQAMSLM